MLKIFAVLDKLLGLINWVLDRLDKERAKREARLEIEHEINVKREADAQAAEQTDADARTADIAVIRDSMRKYERH